MQISTKQAVGKAPFRSCHIERNAIGHDGIVFLKMRHYGSKIRQVIINPNNHYNSCIT